MTRDELSRINTTALAYLGDAVYEVIVREMILTRFPRDAGKAHKHAVHYVSAEGQAKAARALLAGEFLSDDETALLKRARNHRTMSRPQHADPRDYKLATGFEALLGYLHLAGRDDRVSEIAQEAFRIIDDADKVQ
ncbi:MAG: Mini-ribonuclease 3 [Mogibacterium sp.]|nr:Mini-ribonuclease 3 [Mogibacterium sp.]MBR2540126.1 Mini-ribonuclease 3 [Mogibacterium sp.]